jgi:hypothetical protein
VAFMIELLGLRYPFGIRGVLSGMHRFGGGRAWRT